MLTHTAARSESNGTPAVSVIIPVHNCERFVPEAVESILGQTLQDLELILVDDGSTDRSSAILDGYAAKDPRVRVVRHEQAKGRGAARNAGIEAARAGLVAFSDADDVSVPERLERHTEYLDAHPDVGFVVSPRVVTDLDGNAIGSMRIPGKVSDLPERMRRHCHLGHCSAMYRTADIRRIGGYRNGFAAAQDYDMLLRLMETAKVGVLDIPVYRYRQVPTGVKYGGGDVQHECADLARLFARQRAEKGRDDYDEYMQAGKMPRMPKGAGPAALSLYYDKLARTALDCGSYGAMLKFAWKGFASRPTRLPRFAWLVFAGGSRLALQAVGMLDWFERTFRGR